MWGVAIRFLLPQILHWRDRSGQLQALATVLPGKYRSTDWLD